LVSFRETERGRAGGVINSRGSRRAAAPAPASAAVGLRAPGPAWLDFLTGHG
jgi:hypothetical protein